MLGGLDLDELARRLADGPGGPPDPSGIRAAMPEAYRAHDAAIAAGAGHEGAWRALVGALVDGAGSHPDPASREAAIDALRAAQPTRNLWRHVPEAAHALLRALSDAGVPMVVTSNSEGRAAELLAEVGIATHFRAILDSGRLGLAKPDPRIFEAAASFLGVPLAAVVHVGDSEAADVVGAHRAGAQAVRFDGFVPGAGDAPTEADARTSSHAELAELLLDAWSRRG